MGQGGFLLKQPKWNPANNTAVTLEAALAFWKFPNIFWKTSSTTYIDVGTGLQAVACASVVINTKGFGSGVHVRQAWHFFNLLFKIAYFIINRHRCIHTSLMLYGGSPELASSHYAFSCMHNFSSIHIGCLLSTRFPPLNRPKCSCEESKTISFSDWGIFHALFESHASR